MKITAQNLRSEAKGLYAYRWKGNPTDLPIANPSLLCCPQCGKFSYHAGLEGPNKNQNTSSEWFNHVIGFNWIPEGIPSSNPFVGEAIILCRYCKDILRKSMAQCLFRVLLKASERDTYAEHCPNLLVFTNRTKFENPELILLFRRYLLAIKRNSDGNSNSAVVESIENFLRSEEIKNWRLKKNKKKS